MTDFWKFYCIIYDNDVILKQFDGDKYDGFSEKPSNYPRYINPM